MAPRTKLRILVVDDDEDICLYLKEFLTREGYSVSTATKPLDALPEVVDRKCQLALIDVRMPQMNGVEFLREIRSINPELCVILMTAYPSVEGAVDSMKADAFDYLLKPFELDQLRQVIQRAVRERGLLIDTEMRVNRLVGARIRTVRKERSMTLRQLARKTALSVSLLSQIELGKSSASISTMRKTAVALSVPLSYLFDGV